MQIQIPLRQPVHFIEQITCRNLCHKTPSVFLNINDNFIAPSISQDRNY